MAFNTFYTKFLTHCAHRAITLVCGCGPSACSVHGTDIWANERNSQLDIRHPTQPTVDDNKIILKINIDNVVGNWMVAVAVMMISTRTRRDQLYAVRTHLRKKKKRQICAMDMLEAPSLYACINQWIRAMCQ